MKNTASLNRISSLSAYLHDEFVGCGEIPDAEHIARLISECEPDFLSQLTDEEILVAVHNATDSTCDSYIINASDSTEWTQGERDDETAKWEALRPKRIREKQISETLRVAITEQKLASAKEIQNIANSFARKNGHGRATKVTLSAAITAPMIGETTRYGYRKKTTGQYVCNKYRSNYGWKNTYYQAAECEVILPASILA